MPHGHAKIGNLGEAEGASLLAMSRVKDSPLSKEKQEVRRTGDKKDFRAETAEGQRRSG
jgi:hypothetical protein